MAVTCGHEGTATVVLEDTAQAALESLLMLHGPLMLATSDGRTLADDADRMRLTRNEQSRLRNDAKLLADRLGEAPEIIEPDAAELMSDAANVIGAGAKPERGTAWGVATIRNV